MRQSLLKLNFFPSTPPTNDLRQLQLQYLSTRTFIITFNLCLVTLLFYNTITPSLKKITIIKPTIQQYNQLYTTHSKTLACSCSQISIDTNKFINISFIQHQICDSVFISTEWISSIGSNLDSIPLTDFRKIGTLLLQGIGSLCALTKATIENSLKQLYSSHFISAFTVPEEFLRTQMNTLVEQFIASTTNTFTLSLLTIRDITQANGLLSAMLTNYFLTKSLLSRYIGVVAIEYGNDCNCKSSSECITQVGIHMNDSSSEPLWFVPGFFVGCFILEALRHSRLECFYNQSCLHEIRNYLSTDSWIDPLPLTQSDSSRFNPSTLFGDMVDKLLVDAWNWTISFDDYFDQCQPKECIYTDNQRNNPIAIITSLISLSGGLMTALKLLVPKSVIAVLYLYGFIKKNRVHSSEDQNPSQDIVVEEI